MINRNRELSFEQDMDKITLKRVFNTVQITHCTCLFVRYSVLQHAVTVTQLNDKSHQYVKLLSGIFVVCNSIIDKLLYKLLIPKFF